MYYSKRISSLAISLTLLASLLPALGIFPSSHAQKRGAQLPIQAQERKVLSPPAVAPACNLIENGDFSAGINVVTNSAGSMPPSSVSNWTRAFASPQLSALPGCGGSPGFISMWGNNAVGEAIKQTLSSPIQAGHTYKLSA